ncbi:MAG: NAD(P)/FAD-dependent oxidoreductase [Opitutales bacterium]
MGEDRPILVIIGGGAAGFFAAITAAEASPAATVHLFDRSRRFLQKVKISGGGRCNVTHACFEPEELVRRYPRGARELIGPFHRWQPADTVDWFATRGVPLKTEADGRMFPTTDSSTTVIDCLMQAARQAGVHLHPGIGLDRLVPRDGGFVLTLTDASTLEADRVCLAPGSLKSSPLAGELEQLGHTLEPLAPSLFAFNVSDPRIRGLAGIAVEACRTWIAEGGERQTGPVLITHRGFSGPGILKLSAWEARRLQAHGYRFTVVIDWLGGEAPEHVAGRLEAQRRDNGATPVKRKPLGSLPRRLWERLLEAAGIAAGTAWAQLTRDQSDRLVGHLTADTYAVTGKTTNKEEFVTCGGVSLKEVDFRTFESRIVPGLHFAGEVLDIDGITGGFNFQAAWTGGHLAGAAMAEAAAAGPGVA